MQSEFQTSIEAVRDQLKLSLSSKLRRMHSEFELAFVEFWNEIPRKITCEEPSGRSVLTPSPLINCFESFVACFEELGFSASLDSLRSSLNQLEIGRLESSSGKMASESSAHSTPPSQSAPSETAEKKQPSKKNQKDTSSQQSSKSGSGVFSKIKGLISKKEENIPEADLDDNVKSYYDPVKKRWIFEGEPEEEEAPLAPPPKKTQAKPEAPQADPSPAPSPASGKQAQIDSLIKPPDRRKTAKKAPGSTAPTTVLQAPPVAAVPKVEVQLSFWDKALTLFEPVVRQAEALARAESKSEALRSEIAALQKKQVEESKRSADQIELVKNDVVQFVQRWAKIAKIGEQTEGQQDQPEKQIETSSAQPLRPRIDSSLLEEEERLLLEFETIAGEIEESCSPNPQTSELARVPIDVDPFVRCALQEPPRDKIIEFVELACSIIQESEQGGPSSAQMLKALETVLT